MFEQNNVGVRLNSQVLDFIMNKEIFNDQNTAFLIESVHSILKTFDGRY